MFFSHLNKTIEAIIYAVTLLKKKNTHLACKNVFFFLILQQVFNFFYLLYVLLNPNLIQNRFEQYYDRKSNKI